jgi:hypothetical protein
MTVIQKREAPSSDFHIAQKSSCAAQAKIEPPVENY